MMSPGATDESGTWGSVPSCALAECGRETPACAQAHIVRPEQSNELGPAAPKTYGAPITDQAAETAIWAAEAFGSGTKPPDGGGDGAGFVRAFCSCAAAAAAAACWAAIASRHCWLRSAASRCCSARLAWICSRTAVMSLRCA